MTKLFDRYRGSSRAIATGWKVSRWYDRHTRSYVVQTLDPDGNQVGDAAYCGTRAWADSEVASRENQLFQQDRT